MSRILFLACACAAWALVRPPSPHAQEPSGGSLDSLVAIALERNPSIAASRARVLVAETRVGPAGALPDPMLSAGIMNMPILEPGFGDFMTATVVGVDQQLPFPGKRSLVRRSAELEVEVAQAQLEETRLEVIASAKTAFYALAHIDESIRVLARSRELLGGIAAARGIAYAEGSAAQGDLLETRTALARLSADSARLDQERRTTLARLNALLDRPGDAQIGTPRVPESITRLITVSRSSNLGLGAASDRLPPLPLPPLSELQARALASSPLLRSHEREIAAQETQVSIARKAHLPDFDLSLQYSRRSRNADMLSFMVSAPVALRRSSRQDLEVASARAEMTAREAEHHAMTNELRAEVAMRYAEAASAYSRFAVSAGSVGSLIRATLDSRVAAYRSGDGSLADVTSVLATSNDYELELHAALVDFATALARLDQVVGSEVLP